MLKKGEKMDSRKKGNCRTNSHTFSLERANRERGTLELRVRLLEPIESPKKKRGFGSTGGKEDGREALVPARRGTDRNHADRERKLDLEPRGHEWMCGEI